MAHGEVEGVDSPKVIRVECVLSGDLGCGGAVQILGEDGDNRIEDRYTGYTERVAAFFEMFADVRIYEREEDNTRLFFDLTEGTVQLARGTDEGIDMSDRAEMGILGGSGFCHRVESLARCI